MSQACDTTAARALNIKQRPRPNDSEKYFVCGLLPANFNLLSYRIPGISRKSTFNAKIITLDSTMVQPVPFCLAIVSHPHTFSVELSNDSDIWGPTAWNPECVTGSSGHKPDEQQGKEYSGSRVACAILLQSVKGPSSPRGPSGERYENRHFPQQVWEIPVRF